MFRATMRPSSGEITVSVRHLVFVTLCRWLFGMQGGMKHSTLHSKQSSAQSDKYQVSHRYSYFSWWWAHSRPKHVEKRNKYTTKNCAPSWLYLQDSNNILTFPWLFMWVQRFFCCFLNCALWYNYTAQANKMHNFLN